MRSFFALVICALSPAACATEREAPLAIFADPGGMIVQKATPAALAEELSAREVDGATVQKHFIAGENQFREGQYAAAAESYRLSIAAEPTLSAELNRGLALLLASKYSQAKTPRGQAGYGGDLFAPGSQWFRA